MSSLRVMAVSAGLIVMLTTLGPPDVHATDDVPAGSELTRLFPHEADVEVDRPGLSRLVLPTEVIAACQADLSDLRLFDAAGEQIPYVIDSRRRIDEEVEIGQVVLPTLSGLYREEVHREDGPPLRRETYTLSLPEAAPEGEGWRLKISPKARTFVARVHVVARSRSGTESNLVSDGSLFRLAGARRAEKLWLALPAFDGVELTISLETEERVWLEPEFRLESSRMLVGIEPIAVPLEARSVREQPGVTWLELVRPKGVVPELLRVETQTEFFDRPVEVRDGGPTGESRVLGQGRIFRIPALVEVAEREIPLRPGRGELLVVSIDHGDSPPLLAPGFSAIIRQPALIFNAPGPVTLRFGGGRAHLPRYDLATLLPATGRPVTGERADASALLYDPATVGLARIGSVRDNAAHDGSPALAFAMQPGAEIDLRPFRHSRPLQVPQSREGLTSLHLEAEDLARLEPGLQDLRVVDEQSRQWPYLLDLDDGWGSVPLDVTALARDGRESRYRFALPHHPLPIDSITLHTGSAYFDRPYRLVITGPDEDDETTMQGRLVRPVGSEEALQLDLNGIRARSLELRVDDGDDAPLELGQVAARVPLPRLYLTAPPGPYSLLLGNPDNPAPRYELERVRDVVLAVNAVPIEAGTLVDNPAYSRTARIATGGTLQTILLWSVLIAAVGVLIWFTLRSATQEPGV